MIPGLRLGSAVTGEGLSKTCPLAFYRLLARDAGAGILGQSDFRVGHPLTAIPLRGIVLLQLSAASRRISSVPIYEYRCSQCGEKFEKLIRSTSGQVEVRCPNCNTDQVDRELSLFGFSGGSTGGSSYSSAASCGPVGG